MVYICSERVSGHRVIRRLLAAVRRAGTLKRLSIRSKEFKAFRKIY
jgi:hypothetical protein